MDSKGGEGGWAPVPSVADGTFFSQTPEPKLALISRKVFGSNVDGREIGSRFYGMSTDPEPIRIRIGLRGIRVDPQPDRGESLRRSG